MDVQSIAEALVPVLVAAKDGALSQASSVATQLGKAGVEKVYSVVKKYFAHDGQGAVKKLDELEQSPASSQVQNAVKGRLMNLLQEDPVFQAEIRAILGEVHVDKSITMTATSGDHSVTTMVVGNGNTIR